MIWLDLGTQWGRHDYTDGLEPQWSSMAPMGPERLFVLKPIKEALYAKLRVYLWQ